MAELRPALPDELSDRMQEGVEPLLAIADTLGYGAEAREAVIRLLAVQERDDEQGTAQVRLLAATREVFDRFSDHALHTYFLLGELNEKEGWDSWYGRGLNEHDLAALLKPYGIRSKNVRMGNDVKKGYHRDDLASAWARYLPQPGVTDEGANPDENGSVTPVTPVGEEGYTNPSPSDVLSKGGVTGVTPLHLVEPDEMFRQLTGGGRVA